MHNKMRQGKALSKVKDINNVNESGYLTPTAFEGGEISWLRSTVYHIFHHRNYNQLKENTMWINGLKTISADLLERNEGVSNERLFLTARTIELLIRVKESTCSCQYYSALALKHPVKDKLEEFDVKCNVYCCTKCGKEYTIKKVKENWLKKYLWSEV